VEVEESAGVGGNSGPESLERESDMMVFWAREGGRARQCLRDIVSDVIVAVTIANVIA